MDGGTLIAQVLKAHGVENIFTLCGGHISPILVAAKRAGIRVVDTRHEVNAVFAADAEARLTGRPGVAAVTAGPGVTNTLTAVKNAQLAQSPLVVLGGATATVLRGRGSLQDIDQMSLVDSCVKWKARPDKLKDVEPALRRAFEVAQSGVPGPVFVELAVDLLYDESIVREWYSAKTDGPARGIADMAIKWYLKRHLNNQFAHAAHIDVADPIPVHPPDPAPGSVHRAKELLAAAKRPVILIGSQTLLLPKKLDRLIGAINTLDVPVYLSGMARGLLGKDHPLQMRHKRRNALRDADLVILCGVPCDFRLDYGGHIRGSTPLISANRSPEDLKKNRSPTLAVAGDPCRFLIQLASIFAAPPAAGPVADARREWQTTLRDRDRGRDAEIEKMAREPAEPVNPLAVCQGIERQLTGESVIVADGGDFVATTSYIVKPRGPLGWLDPGVFGTLGVGGGFAAGAKLARPDADVWLVWGDGSAAYSIAEFDTFCRHGLPVIAVVGNDGAWMQILRDQVVILEDDVGCTLERNDYHKVAEAWGGRGLLLDDPAKVDEVFDEAVKTSRAGTPVLVNALIGRTDFRKGSLSM